MFTLNEARALLTAADVFFDPDPTDARLAQTLNMNNVWEWAIPGAEYVSDDELPAVARLFFIYGWCGILYWASKKNGGMDTDFDDVNRAIEFVLEEEVIRCAIPDPAERAQSCHTYMIGGKTRLCKQAKH